jgi:autotransporter-associated beta strand protein
MLTLAGGAGNALAGAINVNAGTLTITKGADDVSSVKNMPGIITVASGATLNFDQAFTTAPDNNLTNALNLSGVGTGGKGALNLWRNATASGTITLAADTTISHDFNNATISGSITGAGSNLTLATTESSQPGMVISGPISLDTGGITVNGAGGTNTVTLSGNNSYSGETHVVTGELKLTGTARVPNASTVRIDTGAVLHLGFAGTDTVGALYLPGDPNPKPNGTYGSLTSTATNKSADFLGDGILQVGAGGGSPYATWAGSALFTDDANGDGVDNGLAWILGAASPTVSALNKLPQVGTPSGYLTLSFSRVNPYAPAKLYIEYSINLSTWTKLEIPPASGTIPSSDVEVVVTPGSPDAVTVKIPTTHAFGGKLFGRLSSTEN